MPPDPAQAVLRDFEHLAWLTLLFGLVLFGAWRFFFHPARRAAASAPGSDTPGPAPPAVVAPPAFGWPDLVFLPLLLVKYLVTLQLLAGSLFTRPAAAAADGSPEAGPAVMEINAALVLVDMSLSIFLISMVILMVQWVGDRSPSAVFGMFRLGPGKLALWIAAGALAATPAVLLLSQAMPALFAPLLGPEMEEQAAVSSMRQAQSLWLKVLLVANACLVAPLVEELVFRGYFYGTLKRYTGAMFAALVTGAFFAVAHQNLLALLPLWGLALFLSVFYEASRCIWVPVGIHAVFNAVNVIYLLAYGDNGP